ncbi:bifunctional helix-turn-helix transcriptional regulator/GNAT family N-acetyltransferase [Brevibacillus sp. SYSU BS000544]|uniref:bifunctional helix-turn-helix transcriptional regulator/GNAT family N-acetyltransferase n=1 Tax=Brevibacillus sp. SYSU BS000544 TaxID=3416443 RepID=UPI003CE57E14
MNGIADRISHVRHFNRFITRQIGVLDEGLLDSEFSLTEARILFELAHHAGVTASDLANELRIDPGYLSRILARLEQRELIDKVRSEEDGRQRILRLTPQGQVAFAVLDQRSHEEVANILSDLSEEKQEQLISSMQTIERVLSKKENDEQIVAKNTSSPPTYFLRSHQPGDMGWITHRHGVLYAQEYGWNEQFEALVARITSHFITRFNPLKERCWIAEMDGEIIGSVMVVQENEEIAKLRLLLVEPKARGLGLGTRLVEECIRFARAKGYQKMVLWTNSVLDSARLIYQKAGFQLVAEEKHHSFGHDLVGETWERIL